MKKHNFYALKIQPMLYWTLQEPDYHYWKSPTEVKNLLPLWTKPELS